MSPRNRRQAYFVCVFIVVALLFAFSFKMAVVRGNSMLPTYHDGQTVLVTHWNTGPNALKRGDVVILHNGQDTLIKRVAFLPGEIIPVKYTRAFSPSARGYFEEIRSVEAIYDDSRVLLKVPAGHVVVLGDNLGVSDDSRAFGPVAYSDIEGRVVNSPPPPFNL